MLPPLIENLLKKFWVKMAIILGVLGFFVSLILVLVAGGGLFALLTRPLASAIIMSLFWTMAYFIVKKFVPDFANAMRESFFPNSSDGQEAGNNEENNPDDDFNFQVNDQDSPATGGEKKTEAKEGTEKVSEDIQLSAPEGGESSKKADKKVKKKRQAAGGDEILVQGVPIKKDPELMAQAIQHVLDTDKE